MKHITAFLFAACAAATAHGILTVSFSFSPTLGGGEDIYGFDGSTWSFTFTSTSETYLAGSGGVNAYVPADTALLTISGAGNEALNTTWDIAATAEAPFALTANYFSSIDLGRTSGGFEVYFSIGDGLVSEAYFNGFGPSPADPVPGAGDPVMASDFAGAMLSGVLSITDGDDNYSDYSLSDASVVVPEPSQWAALLGVGMLALALWRRRR